MHIYLSKIKNNAVREFLRILKRTVYADFCLVCQGYSAMQKMNNLGALLNGKEATMFNGTNTLSCKPGVILRQFWVVFIDHMQVKHG